MAHKHGYEWQAFRITETHCVWRWAGGVAFAATPWETLDDCPEGIYTRYAFQPRGQGYAAEEDALLNPEPAEHYTRTSWYPPPPPGIKEEQT